VNRTWRTFVDALRGTPRDSTTGSVGEAVVLLGIPMILEMSMESFFAVTDRDEEVGVSLGDDGPSAGLFQRGGWKTKQV
jgi:hypothetical protein